MNKCFFVGYEDDQDYDGLIRWAQKQGKKGNIITSGGIEVIGIGVVGRLYCGMKKKKDKRTLKREYNKLFEEEAEERDWDLADVKSFDIKEVK